ncbi:MAG: methionine--tRNA ligase subunit beta [Candidatus Micrarchaeales archaeon]
MKKGNFDLDMIDEYPDALGSKNRAEPSVSSKPVEDIVQKEETRTQYEGITFGDFAKVDLRVGRIKEVSEVPGAKKPLWKLRVDLGHIGMRTIVAGIKSFYSADELIGRQIIVVVNLKPRSLAGIMSEGMLLAAEDGPDNISLISPDKDMEPGCKIG